MRTRLDEIVEEMGNYLGCKDYKWLLDGLNRAFRHGVEQGYGKATVNMLITLKCKEEIQFAPAEEKCSGWAHGEKYKDIPCIYCGKPDRRKGERRKGLETINYIRGEKFSDIKIWRMVSISWQYDRRSGKDRRK